MAAALDPITGFTRIEIERTPPAPLDRDTQRRVDEAWDALRARNPRYFNAPILAFESYDSTTGIVSARVDEYKRHAVRDTIDLGVSLLAVTATLCRPDQGRRVPTYLLGRRSHQTHRYGGMWELGPSGGIEPPEGEGPIDLAGLLAQIDREVREEVGLSVLDQPAAPVTLVHDERVGSSDIHVGIVLADPHRPSPNWEYDETRWVSLDELLDWCGAHPDEIIPTTIAHARFLRQARA